MGEKRKDYSLLKSILVPGWGLISMGEPAGWALLVMGIFTLLFIFPLSVAIWLVGILLTAMLKE